MTDSKAALEKIKQIVKNHKKLVRLDGADASVARPAGRRRTRKNFIRKIDVAEGSGKSEDGMEEMPDGTKRPVGHKKQGPAIINKKANKDSDGKIEINPHANEIDPNQEVRIEGDDNVIRAADKFPLRINVPDPKAKKKNNVIRLKPKKKIKETVAQIVTRVLDEARHK
jgi:hypothetical protein